MSGIPEHRVLIVCPSKTGYAHLCVVIEPEQDIPGRIVPLGQFDTHYLNPVAPAFYEGIIRSFVAECVNLRFDASRFGCESTPPLEKDFSKLHRLYRKPEKILFAIPLQELAA